MSSFGLDIPWTLIEPDDSLGSDRVFGFLDRVL